MNGYVFGLIPADDFGNRLMRLVLHCRGVLPRSRNGYYPSWAFPMRHRIREMMREHGWTTGTALDRMRRYCIRGDWRSLDPYGRYGLQRGDRVAIRAWLLDGDCLWGVRL